MSSTKRRILREKARRKMKKNGLRQINKHSYIGPLYMREVVPSYFANNWKKYI